VAPPLAVGRVGLAPLYAGFVNPFGMQYREDSSTPMPSP
jgi:hypothetical protein